MPANNYQQNIVLRRTPPSLQSLGEGQIVFAIAPNKSLGMYTKQAGQLFVSRFFPQRVGEVVDNINVKGKASFQKKITVGRAELDFDRLTFSNGEYIDNSTDGTLSINANNIDLDNISGTKVIKSEGNDAITLTPVAMTASLPTTIDNTLNFKNDIEVRTADLVLTSAYSNTVLVWNDAGAVFTLPDSGTAANIGCTFTFFVLDATSGTKKIVCTDTTNEKIYGYFTQYDTDSSNALALYRGTSSTNFSAITFDGTTTGTLGSHCTLTAVAADTWVLTNAVSFASGTVATPFSTS